MRLIFESIRASHASTICERRADVAFVEERPELRRRARPGDDWLEALERMSEADDEELIRRHEPCYVAGDDHRGQVQAWLGARFTCCMGRVLAWGCPRGCCTLERVADMALAGVEPAPVGPSLRCR